MGPVRTTASLWLCVLAVFAYFWLLPENQSTKIVQAPLLDEQERAFVVEHAPQHADNRHTLVYEDSALAGWWNGTMQPRIDQLLLQSFGFKQADFVVGDLFMTRYAGGTHAGLPQQTRSQLTFTIQLSLSQHGEPSSRLQGGGVLFDAAELSIEPELGAVLLYESHVEHQRLAHALDPYGDLLVLAGAVAVQPWWHYWWRTFGWSAHCFEVVVATQEKQSEPLCVSRFHVIWHRLSNALVDLWIANDHDDAATKKNKNRIYHGTVAVCFFTGITLLKLWFAIRSKRRRNKKADERKARNNRIVTKAATKKVTFQVEKKDEGKSD